MSGGHGLVGSGGGAGPSFDCCWRGSRPAVGREGGSLEERGHHLRVRRAKDGERVAIRDGAGLVGTGRLVRVGQDWVVEMESLERQLAPAELTLAVAAGDRERFTWMVEKAVELGVTTLSFRSRPRGPPEWRPVSSGHTWPSFGGMRSRPSSSAGHAVGPAPWTSRSRWSASSPGERAGQGWLADPAGVAPPATLGRETLRDHHGARGWPDRARARVRHRGGLSAGDPRPQHAALRDRGTRRSGGGRGGETAGDAWLTVCSARSWRARSRRKSSSAPMTQLAFRDIDAKAPVHVLVIPAKHVPARARREWRGRRAAAGATARIRRGGSEGPGTGWGGYRIVTNTGEGRGAERGSPAFASARRAEDDLAAGVIDGGNAGRRTVLRRDEGANVRHPEGAKRPRDLLTRVSVPAKGPSLRSG